MLINYAERERIKEQRYLWQRSGVTRRSMRCCCWLEVTRVGDLSVYWHGSWAQGFGKVNKAMRARQWVITAVYRQGDEVWVCSTCSGVIWIHQQTHKTLILSTWAHLNWSQPTQCKFIWWGVCVHHWKDIKIKAFCALRRSCSLPTTHHHTISVPLLSYFNLDKPLLCAVMPELMLMSCHRFTSTGHYGPNSCPAQLFYSYRSNTYSNTLAKSAIHRQKQAISTLILIVGLVAGKRGCQKTRQCPTVCIVLHCIGGCLLTDQFWRRGQWCEEGMHLSQLQLWHITLSLCIAGDTRHQNVLVHNSFGSVHLWPALLRPKDL